MSTSHVVDLAAKILIISLVTLSMLIIFVSFVHLYAKWFWNRPQAAPNTRRRRGDFTAGHQEQQSAVTVLRCGLSPSFLETIPVIPFDPNNFKEGLECVVCLSEFDEGDKTRVLPKCNHGFHVECIDMWFYSHSTCPICRNSVSDETKISVENLLGSRETQEESTDSQVFPTNVLFFGDEMEVSILTSQLEEANSNSNNNNHGPILTSEAASSSSSSYSSSSHTITGRPDLIIDIPRLQVDCDEDKKSPVSSRVKSLRRILSGSRRFINNPFSINTEQGRRGHL